MWLANWNKYYAYVGELTTTKTPSISAATFCFPLVQSECHGFHPTAGHRRDTCFLYGNQSDNKRQHCQNMVSCHQAKRQMRGRHDYAKVERWEVWLKIKTLVINASSGHIRWQLELTEAVCDTLRYISSVSEIIFKITHCLQELGVIAFFLPSQYVIHNDEFCSSVVRKTIPSYSNSNELI